MKTILIFALLAFVAFSSTINNFEQQLGFDGQTVADKAACLAGIRNSVGFYNNQTFDFTRFMSVPYLVQDLVYGDCLNYVQFFENYYNTNDEGKAIKTLPIQYLDIIVNLIAGNYDFTFNPQPYVKESQIAVFNKEDFYADYSGAFFNVTGFKADGNDVYQCLETVGDMLGSVRYHAPELQSENFEDSVSTIVNLIYIVAGGANNCDAALNSAETFFYAVKQGMTQDVEASVLRVLENIAENFAELMVSNYNEYVALLEGKYTEAGEELGNRALIIFDGVVAF